MSDIATPVVTGIGLGINFIVTLPLLWVNLNEKSRFKISILSLGLLLQSTLFIFQFIDLSNKKLCQLDGFLINNLFYLILMLNMISYSKLIGGLLIVCVFAILLFLNILAISFELHSYEASFCSILPTEDQNISRVTLIISLILPSVFLIIKIWKLLQSYRQRLPEIPEESIEEQFPKPPKRWHRFSLQYPMTWNLNDSGSERERYRQKVIAGLEASKFLSETSYLKVEKQKDEAIKKKLKIKDQEKKQRLKYYLIYGFKLIFFMVIYTLSIMIILSDVLFKLITNTKNPILSILHFWCLFIFGLISNLELIHTVSQLYTFYQKLFSLNLSNSETSSDEEGSILLFLPELDHLPTTQHLPLPSFYPPLRLEFLNEKQLVLNPIRFSDPTSDINYKRLRAKSISTDRPILIFDTHQDIDISLDFPISRSSGVSSQYHSISTRSISQNIISQLNLPPVTTSNHLSVPSPTNNNRTYHRGSLLSSISGSYRTSLPLPEFEIPSYLIDPRTHQIENQDPLITENNVTSTYWCFGYNPFF